MGLASWASYGEAVRGCALRSAKLGRDYFVLQGSVGHAPIAVRCNASRYWLSRHFETGNRRFKLFTANAPATAAARCTSSIMGVILLRVRSSRHEITHAEAQWARAHESGEKQQNENLPELHGAAFYRIADHPVNHSLAHRS